MLICKKWQDKNNSSVHSAVGESQSEARDIGIPATGWLLKHFIDLHVDNRLAAYWKGPVLEPSWQGGMCPGAVLCWALCHMV